MRRTAQLLAGIALLGGCRGERMPTEVTADIQPQAVASRSSREAEDNTVATLNGDLATLRRVTAPFHSFEKAVAAGWSAQITPCMTDPAGAGGMGFHYGNVGLIDGTARVDEPELLLYEPEKNGRLRLAAVEYIIPYTLHSRSAAPPVLFGQEFKQNDTFQLWGLHAWVWENNPSGVFASWNPRVTCEHTTTVSTMIHQRTSSLNWGTPMPKYLIEREIPNAGALSAGELQSISQRSCAVLQQLGPSIQWVQSYVTEDKITCVYIAPNAELIREHAKRGGFPADRVLEVGTIIDPTTAESNELAATAGA